VQPPQALSLLPRKSRDFKIVLSLDGDGIRGLSQVFLVEALVGAICTKLDRNIDPYQIFDLVGGTSMGGVLGLMLSRLRMQAHEAREAYKLVGKEVFQDKKAYFSSLDPHAGHDMYDGQGVEEAIKTVVAGELPQVNERLYDAREDSADV
jgi:patatin-like phospholipase/acyl hydrolase